LPPLAITLNEEEFLEREGSPLTEDFSTVKGAGLRATDAITEEAISAETNCCCFCKCFFFAVENKTSATHNNNNNSGQGFVIAFLTRGVAFVAERGI